jgi:signal transduction histidine kinase
MTLNLREADFNTFLRDLAEFTSYEMSDAHVDLELDLEEKLPLIDFDEQLMKQALLNLIQNAVAAMEHGGKITLKTERKDNTIVLSVIDTGSGIPDHILAKIFEPYFTTKALGSGLGLTLVFKIINEHHGEIAVASKEGEGTCFTITLPIPQREKRLLPAVTTNNDQFIIEELQ